MSERAPIDYPMDYHIHSCFSCDSESDVADICIAAMGAGFKEIGISDHVDFGPDDPADYFKPAAYLEEIKMWRHMYSWIKVRLGLEIGEPHLFPERAQAILSQLPVDFVIGSAHYNIHMEAAWKEAYFETHPLRETCETYFQQVAALAAEGDFDILGHLDLIKRDARKFGLSYDGPEPYADLIRQALRSVIDRGKAIEINTSPLRRRQPEPCPSVEILRWYREMGGEYITLGSDAHTPEAIGAHFDEALELARSVGFEYLARFRDRKMTLKKF